MLHRKDRVLRSPTVVENRRRAPTPLPRKDLDTRYYSWSPLMAGRATATTWNSNNNDNATVHHVHHDALDYGFELDTGGMRVQPEMERVRRNRSDLGLWK